MSVSPSSPQPPPSGAFLPGSPVALAAALVLQVPCFERGGRRGACGAGPAALSPLAFPRQVWESVPYLASYVSPALRAGRSIPLLPRELEVAWNGKSRCATPEHVRGDTEARLQSCPLPQRRQRGRAL